ncbi:MAG: flagellar hook-associated protein 3 [Nitrospirae bacterium]|nr:flagellar hook-associated protein 3 [Nitrospirota bacterium]
MRISSFAVYDRLTRALQENLRRLYETQETLATGKKINRPSQDIVGASRALDYKVSITEAQQNIKNIEGVTVYLEITEGILGDATNALSRLKELSLTALNGSTDSEGRAAIAKEVRELKGHLLSLGNSTVQGKYIFSGYLTDTRAFDPVTYAYQGDGNSLEVKVGADSMVKENLTGNEAFAYVQPSHEVITLDEGARYIHYIPGQAIDAAYPSNRVIIAIASTDDPSAVEAELQAGPPYTTVEDTFYFDNIFQMTDELQNALENDDTDRINAIMASIDDSIVKVTDARVEMGARINFIETERGRLDNAVLSLKTLLSETEDADLAEVISEVSKNETALQSLRSTGAKIPVASGFPAMIERGFAVKF